MAFNIAYQCDCGNLLHTKEDFGRCNICDGEFCIDICLHSCKKCMQYTCENCIDDDGHCDECKVMSREDYEYELRKI